MKRSLIQEIDAETGTVMIETHRLNGRLHHDPMEGPAYVHRTATGEVAQERYYRRGRLHREEGAAKVEYDLQRKVCLEMYYRHGLLHRDPNRGPAWIERNGPVVITESYYLHGEPYRDPKDGPRHIARFDSGEIEYEVYCDAGEAPPGRPACKRSGPSAWQDAVSLELGMTPPSSRMRFRKNCCTLPDLPDLYRVDLTVVD